MLAEKHDRELAQMIVIVALQMHQPLTLALVLVTLLSTIVIPVMQ